MGLVFSVICLYFLVFTVKLANFFMFIFSGENTVSVWRDFREKPIAFYYCKFSSTLRKSVHELLACAQRGFSLFLRPKRDSILGNCNVWAIRYGTYP